MTAVLVSLALAGLVAGLLRARNGRFRAAATVSAGAAAALPAPGRRATFVQVSTEACATCPRVAATLDSVASGVPGVRFVELPAESHPDLLEAYDIRRSPTVFLLDAAGEVRLRTSGPVTADQALGALADLLGTELVPTPTGGLS